MNERRRPLVLLYALGSLIVVLVFVALTLMVVRQQRAHAHAVADALYHEDVRTALWRMDTRVGTLLATTTNRVSGVGPGHDAYSSGVIDPSANLLDATAPPALVTQLHTIDLADQAFKLARAEEKPAEPPFLGQAGIADRGRQRTVDEYAKRSDASQATQTSQSNLGAVSCTVGPLAPAWVREDSALDLRLTRRVEGGADVWHESYRLGWDQLSETLLGEVRDLFPDAQLVPIVDDAAQPAAGDRAMRLATIPARLIAPAPVPLDDLPRGHLWTLAGAWSALLFALVVGAFALRSSYAYADKHRRFTHAVTHELRTPLTTFRMYSEMLAREMVPEAARAEYLATLEAESERLSRLVENVLRYARLEDGKTGPPRTDTTAARLVERCMPELARTCATFGARLEMSDTVEGDVAIRTDVDAVLQVLSNLVENACKYGRSVESDAHASPIRLRVSHARAQLHFEVADEGAGVSAAVARSIFEPFDRGGRDSSDRASGVGLGLALARALAHELGGSLALVPTPRGATFRLSLPA